MACNFEPGPYIYIYNCIYVAPLERMLSENLIATCRCYSSSCM